MQLNWSLLFKLIFKISLVMMTSAMNFVVYHCVEFLLPSEPAGSHSYRALGSTKESRKPKQKWKHFKHHCPSYPSDETMYREKRAECLTIRTRKKRYNRPTADGGTTCQCSDAELDRWTVHDLVLEQHSTRWFPAEWMGDGSTEYGNHQSRTNACAHFIYTSSDGSVSIPRRRHHLLACGLGFPCSTTKPW